MRFLHSNESAEWCSEHGMETGERWDLQPDPLLTHKARLDYAPSGPPANAAEVAASCLTALGAWDECLLWVIDWDTWENDEDWPTFYAARGARGERRSLAAKPGHLFGASEVEELRLFLTMVLQYCWDARVLPVHGKGGDRRLWCSHDGWVELMASTPVEIPRAAV